MEDSNVESVQETGGQESAVAAEEKVNESPNRWANINWDEKKASLDQQYATRIGERIV